MRTSPFFVFSFFFVALNAIAVPATVQNARPAAPAAVKTNAMSAQSIRETDLEYAIAEASRLAKGDASTELKELKAQLDLLKQQKQSLISTLLKLQAEISGSEMAGELTEEQRQRIGLAKSKMAAAKSALARIEAEIKAVMQKISVLQNKEDDASDEALEKKREEIMRLLSALAANTPLLAADNKAVAAEQRKRTEDHARRALTDIAQAREAIKVRRAAKQETTLTSPPKIPRP